jgi:hypothetical protein
MAQLGYASQQPDDNNMTQVIHHSATTLGYANVGYRFQNLLGAANDTADQFDGFGPPQFVQNQPEYNGSPRDLTSPIWLNRTFATSNKSWPLKMAPIRTPIITKTTDSSMSEKAETRRKKTDSIANFL